MERTTEATTTDEGQYGAIETGRGDLVIYDRDNPQAWLQSDTTTEVA